MLPAGVTAVNGDFDRGDPLTILGPNEAPLGTGLSRYTADEVALIKGLRSDAIEEILGYKPRSTLIHRDDMVL